MKSALMAVTFAGDCRECGRSMAHSRRERADHINDTTWCRCRECRTINRLDKRGPAEAR